MSTFAKVQSGQPLQIRADTWNVMMDTALWFAGQRARGGQAPMIERARSGILPIKNESEEVDIEPGQALAITGVLIEPTLDPERTFHSRIPLKGKVADETSLPLSFVVAVEPIAAGAIGRAVIAGVTTALVNVADEADLSCQLAADSAVLASSPFGGAPILWKESGTGEKWAVIELGHRLPATVVGTIVEIHNDGVDVTVGDVENDHDVITYDIQVGSRIFENVTPANARPSTTSAIRSAAIGHRAFGYWDGTKVDWHIFEGDADLDPCEDE